MSQLLFFFTFIYLTIALIYQRVKSVPTVIFFTFIYLTIAVCVSVCLCFSSPDCVFLGVAEQERLGLFLPEHTPYRSYARKNIGYLFAIAHGAKVIYETDDDNRFDVQTSLVVYTEMSRIRPFKITSRP